MAGHLNIFRESQLFINIMSFIDNFKVFLYLVFFSPTRLANRSAETCIQDLLFGDLFYYFYQTNWTHKVIYVFQTRMQKIQQLNPYTVFVIKLTKTFKKDAEPYLNFVNTQQRGVEVADQR